jgi:pilus assembly protein CpaE
MSNLALITADATFERRLKEAIGVSPQAGLRRWREEYLRIDPTKVVAEMAEDSPELVCLGPGLELDAALELAGAFDREHPEICVVLVAEPTAELWERALQVGARDVVSPASSSAELGRAVTRALQTARRRRSNLVAPAKPEGPETRVITIVSPKGGAGKTTVAVNLGVGLARRASGQVAVLDLDLQFGDVAAALQLQPEHSLADLAQAGSAVDATLLKVFLVSHPSGLWALCGPQSPVEADDISAGCVSQTIQVLKTEFPLVVIDTSAGLHEETLAALDLSTDLVLVCSMDVAGVRSLRKELDALDRLGLTAARRHLVLNRADSRVGVSAHDIEEVLGMKVDVSVSSSRSVALSMNEGVPVLESSPRSPVARQMEQLVDRFARPTFPPSSSDTVRTTAGNGRLFRHKKEAS